MSIHNNHLKTGREGEERARRHLIGLEYKILATNYREGFDEIDIIARDPDGTLVFCEVKTVIKELLNLSEEFMPEDHFSGKKLYKIERAIQKITAKRPDLVLENRGWRIDLIAITLAKWNILILNHYKNI